MLRIVLICLFAMIGHQVAVAESLHKLKGRIIRSLAVEAGDPRHILVGHKAGKPGSALVFQSLDGGTTWRTLNGNRPLTITASDVQAVAALSKDILLAGTWKNGFYVSRNGGARFSRIEDFPSNDIRDLQIAGGTIYAATARHGVFESTDQGASWQALGPGKDFLWSITAADSRMFASSLELAVHERHDGRWRKVFDGDKAYAAAGVTGFTAIAGETGLHVSAGEGWRTLLAGEKFADVVIIDQDRIIVASWSNGIVVVDRAGQVLKRLLEGQAVVHLQIAGRSLLAGTWGDGLHLIPLAQVMP